MSDSIKVLLYSARSDEPVHAGIAAHVWDHIANDKRAYSVFVGMDVKSLSDFMSFMNNPAHIVAAAFYNERLAAVTWVDCISGKTAHLHFITLRWTYGSINLPVGREILKTLLTLRVWNGYMFDCLIGITPCSNKLALRFIHELGVESVGVLPSGFFDSTRGESVDAMITYCTRQQLMEVSR